MAQPPLVSIGEMRTMGREVFTASELAAIRGMLGYTESTARAHPDAGHRRPVCPFVAGSLQRNLIYVTAHRGRAEPADVERRMLALKTAFAELASARQDAGRFAVILAVFPTVAADDAHRVIDMMQARLRHEFVMDGLLIGEFHPLNDTPGLYSPQYRPLRSPVPALGIRSLVVQDVPFILDSDRWIRAYLAHFGHAGCQEIRAVVARGATIRLDAVRADELLAMVEDYRQAA